MTEVDPLEPRIVVPDVTFVPPTPRTPSGLALGDPVPGYMTVFILLLLAAAIGVGAVLAAVFGDSAEPIGMGLAISLATWHFMLRPRHCWWALLAAVIGFVVSAVPFSAFLPDAYALDCGTAVAIIAYVLVTHLPERSVSALGVPARIGQRRTR